MDVGRATEMTPAVWVGLILGVFGIIGALAKATTVVYRAASRIEKAIHLAVGEDSEGKTLRDQVDDLRAALSNGIRSDVRDAVTAARQARTLAGEAAAASGAAQQTAEDALRATNALRAEVDAVNNAVLADHR